MHSSLELAQTKTPVVHDVTRGYVSVCVVHACAPGYDEAGDPYGYLWPVLLTETLVTETSGFAASGGHVDVNGLCSHQEQHLGLRSYTN